MIRVGFVLNFDESSWLGGINYYRNLINAVCSNREREIEPVIFTGHTHNIKNYEIFPDFEIIKNKMFDPTYRFSFLRNFFERNFHRDFFMEMLLKKNDISVLSHYGSLGKNSCIPTIGWIPDFQHRNMPDFFSDDEIISRDQIFEKICKECTRVILSSNTAKRDAEKFYPNYAEKYTVLHFVAGNIFYDDLPNFEDLKKKYNISYPYFIVPNQFWIHKNHIVILEAIKILKSQGLSCFILATGNTTDYRQPEYYRTIQKKIADYDISDNFQILDIIPYKDLLQLMIHSIAVINPSLFEGWSTTVEEAKALNLNIILSDIEVHREQNPQHGVFFPPDDPQKLADILFKYLKESVKCPKIYRSKEISEKFNEQTIVFAQNYEKIVLDTLNR